jgi:hypothetical protein
MRTLYLRNVPDHVADRLERMAAHAGLSLSAFAVRELGEVARRADNEALLQSLPSLDVDVATINEALEESRSRK